MSGASAVAALFAQRVVVGVGDLAVSNNPQMVISVYALGSCIGVVAYDSHTKAGGIIHLMLPESSISPEKALKQPAMFADSGLPLFFRQLAGVKAERSRLRLFVAGGASVLGGTDPFRIGERNTRVTLDYLIKNGLHVTHTEVGGTVNRTLHLDLNTGAVAMKTPTENGQLSLCA